jgi:putative inorganic carbon (HCO3(-)) transporter
MFQRIGLGLYLVFIVSWFLHSGARYPVLGAMRFDLILVAAIACLCLLTAAGRSSDQSQWTPSRLVLILVGYAFITLPFVEWPGSVLKYGFPEFVKAAVFCLFTSTLATTRRSLQTVLLVFVGCQAFRVLEPLYLHVTEGYWGSSASMANWEFMNRLAGSPSDILNPNGLAYVIVSSLAFIHFLAPLSKTGLVCYLAYLPLALWALMLTASRTGIVALAIVVVCIWWRSRRKLLMATLLTVFIIVVTPVLPPDIADRYLSIFSSNAKNSVTASERSAGLVSGIIVALRRPFFGHGLGTSGEANANFGAMGQPAHNLYVEAAQELGLLGLPLLIAFMVALAREISATARRCRETAQSGFVLAGTQALSVFFWMNVTFSLASYGLSGYEWYLMAGLSAVLARLSLEAGKKNEVVRDRPAPAVHQALRGVPLPGFAGAGTR